jgi:hypothetical protein
VYLVIMQAAAVDQLMQLALLAQAAQAAAVQEANFLLAQQEQLTQAAAVVVETQLTQAAQAALEL